MREIFVLLYSIGATVIVETAVFAAAGYRDSFFIRLEIAINVVTNAALTTALALSLYLTGEISDWFLLGGELLVTFSECLFFYFSYARRLKLCLVTVAANLVSALFGLLVNICVQPLTVMLIGQFLF